MKRHRRTKLEMEAFRKEQKEQKELFGLSCIYTQLIPKADKDMLTKVKSSHKANLEAQQGILTAGEQPILKPSIAGINAALKDVMKKSKVIEGWVNVYHDKVNSYWLGSDIHYTVEGAKKIGEHNKAYLKSIWFSFEDNT